MSDDIINSLMGRIDRLEAIAGSYRDPIDRADEIKALRNQVANLETALLAKDVQIGELRSLVAKKMTRTDVLAIVNREFAPPFAETMIDAVVDDVQKTEKGLREEIADTARTFQRDVERAEAAAASNVKVSAAIIAKFAEELGS